jgi:hypothetical protein
MHAFVRRTAFVTAHTPRGNPGHLDVGMGSLAKEAGRRKYEKP